MLLYLRIRFDIFLVYSCISFLKSKENLENKKFKLTSRENLALSIGAKFEEALCSRRSPFHIVFTLPSVTTSNGWRAVVECGGRHSSSIFASSAARMILVEIWLWCPSNNRRTGFWTWFTAGINWVVNQSKKINSFTQPDSEQLYRVPGYPFRGHQDERNIFPLWMI